MLRLGVHIGDTDIGSGCADCGEFGIFLHRQTPALIIGEMPVEAVEFVVAHNVEHPLDFVGSEEMTAHVEHEAAVAVGRLVHDLNHGEHIFGAGCARFTGHDICRQYFFDCLQAVVKSGRGRGCEFYAVCGHVEIVTLLSDFCITADFHSALLSQFHVKSCGVVKVADKLRHLGLHLRGQPFGCNLHAGRYFEIPVTDSHIGRSRSKVDEAVGKGCEATKHQYRNK